MNCKNSYRRKMLNIDEPPSEQKIALFNSGFRFFFLAAGIFSVISMFIWMLMYGFDNGPSLYHMDTQSWHAHEMIYGYTVAVISGFLLTATTNWTNRKTLTGLSLFILALFWCLVRVLPFISFYQNIAIMFILETLFFLLLMFGIVRPVVQTRQWKQLPVMLPVFFLMLSNAIFYMGQLELLVDGTRMGLYAGFYLILSLIFVMGRRVIPFFIEKGIDGNFKPINRRWIDVLIVPVFIVYAISEVLVLDSTLIMILAAVLLLLNGVRLAGWYTHSIWKKPLLWSLLLAYLFITLGFALRAISYYIEISEFLILHAYAVGGIAMITLGMMSRVALGHTGRNVFEPPAIIKWIMILILSATIFRVGLPLIMIGNYLNWILISQILWIAAYALFVKQYAILLIKPREDGKPG